jgi:mono/diheme cytochrome c family protein
MRVVLFSISFALLSCTDDRTLALCASPPGEPAPVSRAVTYFSDVQPLLAQKCARCHTDGGLAGPALDTAETAVAAAPLIHQVVVDKSMPPYLAAPCCNHYQNDGSLTDEQIALLASWDVQGAPLGTVTNDPVPPPVGGLSRVDVLLEQPEPYTVTPKGERTDDFRCYVVDWPLSARTYITGLNPVPLNRAVVHHLILGVLEGDQLDAARAKDAVDDLPGFECEGGAGSVQVTRYVGGSLAGTDLPEGYGVEVNPGAAMLFNVHYSLAHAAGDRTDQLSLELKVDDNAKALSTILVANPAWLIGDGMRIDAGAKDVSYRVVVQPDIFTGDQPVQIWGINTHLHAYGSRVSMAILPANRDASPSCLLEIPQWQFGWEQTYWLKNPVLLNPDDALELVCTFDNSVERQPTSTACRRRRATSRGAKATKTCAWRFWPLSR